VAMALNGPAASASDSQALAGAWAMFPSASTPAGAEAASKRRRPFAARFGKGHQHNDCSTAVLRSGQNRLASAPAGDAPPLLEGLAQQFGRGVAAHHAGRCPLGSSRAAGRPRAPSMPRSSNSRTASATSARAAPAPARLRDPVLQPEQFAGGSCLGAGSSWSPPCAGPPPPARAGRSRTGRAPSAGLGLSTKPLRSESSGARATTLSVELAHAW